MRIFFEDTQQKKIQGKHEIQFSSFSSFHLITIIARAKGEKQISDHATDDEDLIVKIDDKTFSKLNTQRLIDSPAAFSGGRLHNLSKTVYYLTFLKGKNHTITLESDRQNHAPTVEYMSIATLTLDDTLTLDIDQQAEDGNNRPWITFFLDQLSLASIDLTLTYSRRKWDSDDIKILIDGINQSDLLRSIKHFLWAFVGSLLPWSVPTKKQTQTFSPHLSKGLHYIEIHADRMPMFNEAVFYFGEALLFPNDIPSVDNPKWTGSFYDDTETMLLARAIYGEAGGESRKAKYAIGWAIRNRTEDMKRWGHTYHDVILEPMQYEPFNNPNNDSFNRIANPSVHNVLEKTAWFESYEAAQNTILAKEKDPTGGANHFYSTRGRKPRWADEHTFTIEIGATRFYKL